MDERKRSFRSLSQLILKIGLGSLIIFFLYGTFVYVQLKTIDNPKKCFKTKMFNVHLCPSNSNYVRYSETPKHFFQALILSEDASFWSHKGFDWFEIKESFRRNFLEWRFARGGSTLTQQLAKNLYLSPNKSIDRKFKEFFLAKQLEKKLSKAQILEKYINVVEFGKKLYGLKPAAKKYFDKSVGRLNLLESVYLVSLLPSPRRLSKSFEQRKLSKNNIWRMKIILKRLYRTNRISDEMYVYLEMLLDQEDWPFDSFSEEFINEDFNVEDELLDELSSEDFKDDDEDNIEENNELTLEEVEESQSKEDEFPEEEDDRDDSDSQESSKDEETSIESEKSKSSEEVEETSDQETETE